jgi:CheY-like chemotaxis protein
MDGMDGFEFVRRLRMEVGGRMPVSIWSGKTLTAEDWLLRSANKIVPKGDGARGGNSREVAGVTLYVPAHNWR